MIGVCNKEATLYMLVDIEKWHPRDNLLAAATVVANCGCQWQPLIDSRIRLLVNGHARSVFPPKCAEEPQIF